MTVDVKLRPGVSHLDYGNLFPLHHLQNDSYFLNVKDQTVKKGTCGHVLHNTTVTGQIKLTGHQIYIDERIVIFLVFESLSWRPHKPAPSKCIINICLILNGQ